MIVALILPLTMLSNCTEKQKQQEQQPSIILENDTTETEDSTMGLIVEVKKKKEMPSKPKKKKHFWDIESYKEGDVLYESTKASYYADYFHGRKTANGETFDMYELTAAHKTLPFGTLVKVTNLKNNKEVIVRINDRGPYIKGREIDLSLQGAEELDMIKAGVVPVKIELVEPIERAISSFNQNDV